jgi:two-component system, chemotaxis family, response regulator Rcp1
MTTTPRRTARPFTLLLVQQAAPDAAYVREVVESASAPHRVEALSGDDLRRRGEAAGSASPDLILLDLDMSVPAARQMLAELKRDPALRHVPLVVFTRGATAADLEECYRLHANCCLVKPDEPEALRAQLQAALRFWLGGAVQLPGRPVGSGW